MAGRKRTKAQRQVIPVVYQIDGQGTVTGGAAFSDQISRAAAGEFFYYRYESAGLMPVEELQSGALMGVLITGPPTDREARRGPRCGARTRAGGECRMVAEPGKKRCRLHGGKSTGPKTEAGRQAIAESNRRRAKEAFSQ